LRLCLNKFDNECKLLDKCSQANCEKFGIVSCNIEFEPEQLKYGEVQSFFVRTYGKSPNSSVDSNISSQRIELDRVKPENLKVTTSEKRIDVVIPEIDKPRGSYSRIRIWCLDLELNNADGEVTTGVFTDCSGLSCACINLWSGSSYNITLQTFMDTEYTEWRPVNIVLPATYCTKVIQPINVKFNESDLELTSVRINWQLPQRRFTGFTFEIRSLNLIKSCLVSDSLSPVKRSSHRTEDVCLEQNNNQASFIWKNLDPGEEYQILIKTFKRNNYAPETTSEVFPVDVLTSK